MMEIKFGSYCGFLGINYISIVSLLFLCTDKNVKFILFYTSLTIAYLLIFLETDSNTIKLPTLDFFNYFNSDPIKH